MINFQKLFNRLELNESEADRLKHLYHEMNNSSAIKDNECSDVIERSQVLLSKWDGVIQREIKRHAKCCFSDEENNLFNGTTSTMSGKFMQHWTGVEDSIW